MQARTPLPVPWRLAQWNLYRVECSVLEPAIRESVEVSGSGKMVTIVALRRALQSVDPKLLRCLSFRVPRFRTTQTVIQS